MKESKIAETEFADSSNRIVLRSLTGGDHQKGLQNEQPDLDS